MKKILLPAGLFVFVPLIVSASIPAGRGEITLSASASATYDSNVSGRRGAADDYYGTFSPRASYIRRAGRIEADANVSVSVTRWVDHAEFDSENFAADASLRLSPQVSPNLSGSLTAGYAESYDVDFDLNRRVKVNSASLSFQSGLVTGPRTQFNFNGAYSNADRVGASDQETVSGGVGFNYSGFLDGTTLGLTYGYVRADSSGVNFLGVGLDQESHSFGASLSRAIYSDVTGRIGYGYRWLERSSGETLVGAPTRNGGYVSAGLDGPFLPRGLFPKIKSHASFSYEDAQTPGINDDGGKQLTGDIGLTWDARQSTSVTLGTSRSQRLSTTDLTVISSSVRANVTQQFRHNMSGSAGLAYNWETYRGLARKDKIFLLTSSVNYSFGRNWSSSASYNYTSSGSTQLVSDFTKHLVTLTLGHTF